MLHPYKQRTLFLKLPQQDSLLSRHVKRCYGLQSRRFCRSNPVSFLMPWINFPTSLLTPESQTACQQPTYHCVGTSQPGPFSQSFHSRGSQGFRGCILPAISKISACLSFSCCRHNAYRTNSWCQLSTQIRILRTSQVYSFRGFGSASVDV